MSVNGDGDRVERSTISGIPYQPVYTPKTTPIDYEADLGDPGSYPFTRGVYETMYRGKPWTMRQFAGFGTAEETNRRFRYLLSHGQTGLSTAFDMPTLMGYDSDHPRSLGEVGREGVAVDTLADMEDLFAGIPLDQVTTSMTVNAPAAVVLAQYVCVAERQGVPPEKLGGTIQADILKEYIAQKEWIFPAEPSMRLMIDMIEWCTEHMPRWHPVSISGYHIREAGATAAQELAFTLADGFAYVERCVERGMDVDEFAPRLSFFFNAHIDFFEEIGKYRAARRIWARELRNRFGAKQERSLLMRFHTQTAGVSLTAQQPLINIARTAIEAMAAVLGGTNSLHTNSFDEALALPTEEAARLALRTQQVILHETGVVHSADPLGGSWLVESMTDELERQAYEYFDRIDRLGGVVAALEQNFFQREIAEAQLSLPAGAGGRRAADRRRQCPYRGRRADPDPQDPRRGGGAPGDAPARGARRAQRRRGRACAGRPAHRRGGRRERDGPSGRVRARLRQRGRDLRRPTRGVGRVPRDARLLGLRRWMPSRPLSWRPNAPPRAASTSSSCGATR